MEKQFVGFMIQDQKYCLPIMDVKEVVRENRLTKMPDAPAFVEGIMNLRNMVVPVISVKKKLGLTGMVSAPVTPPAATAAENTPAAPAPAQKKSDKLIIVSIDGVLIGFLVDALDRVFSIDSSAIQAPERITESAIDRSLVEGVVRLDDTIYLILDVKRLLDVEEKSFIKREIVE